jgi:hypothetical protein
MHDALASEANQVVCYGNGGVCADDVPGQITGAFTMSGHEQEIFFCLAMLRDPQRSLTFEKGGNELSLTATVVHELTHEKEVAEAVTGTLLPYVVLGKASEGERAIPLLLLPPPSFLSRYSTNDGT